MRHLLGAMLLLIAAAASSQVTIGSMPAVPSFQNGAGVSTAIDLSHPATADGTMASASVRWYSGCANAFKLKFLHVTDLTTYTVYAERGPFNATLGTNFVTLSPPVTVQKGDLIAVTQLVSACGGYYYTSAPPSTMAMFFTGDLPNSGTFSGTVKRGYQLNVRASSSTNVLEGVIAGAGSAPGGYGAYFRTSLQLTNPDQIAATGRLVFHPAGTSGSASDPSLSFTIPKVSVVSYNDVVQAMGQSGLGSIDVISTSGSRPLLNVRVFNDAGGAGTSGFTEEIVIRDNAFQALDAGVITMPADLTNYRMNIGVRTFESGATIDFYVLDAAGNIVVPNTDKTAYPPNYFEQVTLQQFINGLTPVANGMLRIRVKSGSLVIYASTTDNRTNDSSIDFAQRE